MKLYHLADLHIGVKDSHTRLVKEKLSALLSEAEKEGVKFILFAGDVFHTNSLPTSEVRWFFELLTNYSNINFVIIPGGGRGYFAEVSGHDAWTEDSIYKRYEIQKFFSSYPHIKLLTPEKPEEFFEKEKVCFYAGFFGLPPERLNHSADFHVAIMHGAYGERKEFEEISLSSEMVQKYDYIALGHYHTFKQVAPNAYYSGAFIQFEYQPFIDAKSGYIKAEIEKGTIPKVTYRIFEDAPQFLHLKIFHEKDLEFLKNLNFPLCKVKISAYLERFNPEIRELVEKWGDCITIFEKAEIKEEKLIFINALEELIKEKIPDTLKEEVRETLLYALQFKELSLNEFVQFLIKKYEI